MTRRLKLLACGSVLALTTMAPSAQSPPLKSVMREKLANTEGMLGAVITADYVAIDRYGEALGRITSTEIGSWQTNAQPEYLRQANAFLSSVVGLREATVRRDLDAISSEYTSLISSCIQCHTTVRHSRVASVAPFDLWPQADASTARPLRFPH